MVKSIPTPKAMISTTKLDAISIRQPPSGTFLRKHRHHCSNHQHNSSDPQPVDQWIVIDLHCCHRIRSGCTCHGDIEITRQIAVDRWDGHSLSDFVVIIHVRESLPTGFPFFTIVKSASATPRSFSSVLKVIPLF